MLAIEYHVYIWQVSRQLSCGDTCQIWMLSKESNRLFRKIENLAYGEINERSFINPQPWFTAGYKPKSGHGQLITSMFFMMKLLLHVSIQERFT